MYSSFYPGYLLIFNLSIFISVDYQLVHYFIYLFFCQFICLFVYLSVCSSFCLATRLSIYLSKDVMQGKLFQKCTHLLYCSVLSLGGNVNTRRMLQPDMGSIFHIKKKSMKYSGHRKLLCESSKLSKFNALKLLGY